MNTERYLLSLGLATVLALTVSCSQDDGQLGADTQGTASSLALSAIYADHGSDNAPATRALTTPDLPTTTAVGFFVKADAMNGYTAINNRKGEHVDVRNQWIPTPDSIWLNNHDADIAIYAPYDAEQTTAGRLKLTAALRLDDSKDLWCKRLSANNRTQWEAPATLMPTLEHVYTRLTVTLVKDEHYVAADKLVDLTLKGTDICDAATYNPFADTDADRYTPVTSGNGFTATPSAPLLIGTDPDAIKAVKVDMLLIPCELTGSTTLIATIAGAKLQVLIDPARFGGELAAGKQYQAKVTLKAGKLELSSLEITDWGTKEFDGGNMKPIITPIPTEPTATIGGVEWAAYNCDGTGGVVTKPWEYGYYYIFEEGDGTGGTRCPAGYRQPTTVELQKLVASKAPAGIAIKINGKKYTTNDSGFIGKDADPNSGLVVVEGTNYLFLPAAGYRGYDEGSGTTPTTGAGSYGSYWSSKPYDSSTGNYLDFGSGRANPSYSYRTNGFSVRCVKGTSAP